MKIFSEDYFRPYLSTENLTQNIFNKNKKPVDSWEIGQYFILNFATMYIYFGIKLFSG